MRTAAASVNLNVIVEDRTSAILRGSAWVVAGYVSTQLLRTGAMLILARHFIGPELFGVVGLVAVFLTGLAMFSEIGVVTSIVQHPRGDEPEFLNTAFSLQALRGLAVWTCSLLAAYPLARFYGIPELLPLLAVAGISEVFRGLTSTAVWRQNRSLTLHNLTILNIASEAVGSIVSVLWAIVSPSGWALVARPVAAAAVMAGGSHVMFPGAVRFGWDRSALKDMTRFGGWITLATAMYFLGGQGERLFLGKVATPADLGCFSLAVMICSLPARGLSQLANQVYLPAIAITLRQNPESAIGDFVKARRAFFAAGVAAALGFLVFGRVFVSAVLNPRFDAVGWMLQVLGLRVALEVFAAPVSNLLLASGESKFSAGGNFTRLVLMIAGLWVAFTYFGIQQAVVALVFAQAVSYFPLILGLRAVLPAAAASELRWYAGLLLGLGAAALIVLR